MIELINFTNCEEGRNYNKGTMSKFGIIYNDEYYMLKQQEKKDTHYLNLGYSATYISSIYSEYIASNIAKNLGLNVHETLLGYIIENGKQINVVACKDFLNDHERIVDFKNITDNFNRKNKTNENYYPCRSNVLSHVLMILNLQDEINQEELKQHFWDMFVFDGYIGNFDRNPSNWGIIKNFKTKEKRIAPIFDNGSCLHPKTPRTLMKKYLEDFNQGLEDRSVFNLTSSFQNDNARIFYHHYFQFSDNLDFIRAILRIAPLIIKNHEKNKQIIESLTGLIEEERIQLLTKELDQRLEKMIKPTFEKARKTILENSHELIDLLKEKFEIKINKKIDEKAKHPNKLSIK